MLRAITHTKLMPEYTGARIQGTDAATFKRALSEWAGLTGRYVLQSLSTKGQVSMAAMRTNPRDEFKYEFNCGMHMTHVPAYFHCCQVNSGYCELLKQCNWQVQELAKDGLVFLISMKQKFTTISAGNFHKSK
jgi:hypothetical protein